MSEQRSCDILVIGGGPAGYSAAIRGAQLGASVILADSGSFGGTCLNWGCIPTKFLWEAGHLEKKLKRAADYGISVELKGRDFAALQQKKARSIDLLVKSLRRMIESHGVALVEGAASFLDAHTVLAGTVTVRAEHIIIAAGSRPAALPGMAFDHTRIIDSTDALALNAAPATLMIVGGGAIGVEMAFIFAGAGSAVQLFEKEERILPLEDVELSNEVKRNLERAGVKVITGRVATSDEQAACEKIMVVTGRKSNADTLNLEKAGVVFTPKNIPVNENLQTNIPHIYAAGDIAGKAFLAYTAQAEGIAAAENCRGKRTAVDYSVIPRVVFSQPPAAGIGAREQDVKADQVLIGRFPFSANSRAFIEGERAGWVKVIADKRSGVILGASLVGSSVEEMVPILGLAIRHHLTLHDLRREIFFHPGLAEAIHCASEDAEKRCVDLPKK